MARSLLKLNDLSREDLFEIFEKAKQLKARIKKRESITVLNNKVVGILFESLPPGLAQALRPQH